MKKRIALMLAAVLTLALFGCGSEPAETTIPTETSAPIESAPETTVPETTLPQPPAESLSLNDMIAGSAIELRIEGGAITLSEDGLTIELSTDSLLVYREGYVVAVLKAMPVVIGDTVYVHGGFSGDFLYRDNDFRTVEDSVQPSLFNGVDFFAEEILNALNEPEASAFNRKLLDQVLLPTSMGIEAFHIDMDRLFQDKPLSEYSEVFAQELTDLGYENASDFTYGEYEVLSGAQTLAQSGISDDEETTVAEHTWWQREQSWQAFVGGLSDEERAFAEEKQITLADLSHLNQVCYGAYMDESDDALRQTLEAYYTADIGYLEDMTD